MEVRLLRIDPEFLAEMAVEERKFFLVAGALLNEINTLNKVHVASAQNDEPDAICSLANGLQSMFFARLLAGKLFEFGEFLRKSYWSAAHFQARIRKQLHPDATAALARLQKNLARNRSLANVRNWFSFHYSTDKAEENWKEASAHAQFYLVLGGTVENNFYSLGELVLNWGVLKEFHEVDTITAVQSFFRLIDGMLRDATLFLEGVLIVILCSRVGKDLGELTTVERIFPKTRLSEARLPYFYATETGDHDHQRPGACGDD